MNQTLKKLKEIIKTKQTNLCIAADVNTKKELLKIANELGSYICILKTHIDIVEDFDTELITELQRLSEKHNFLLFEDRKFADIGNTVKHQYQNGIYNIADWAHITNCHIIPGPGIIKGLKEIGLRKNRGLLLLAQMSSKDNLLDDEYTKKCIKMAKEHSDFVIGFIAQEKLIDDENFITMTPGVKIASGTDDLGQQYNTPKKVIGDKKSDIIIVGRGIHEADNPTEEAIKYRDAGWQAYTKK